MEEDKLCVTWHAARIEKWLNENISQGIYIDSYDVTIYPAETSRNTITKMAKSANDLAQDENYSAIFLDLAGGKTEYIVTIACVIGKSRMKGERIVTTLLPYGPEKPRAGMIKATTTNEVEIMWDPPKGEFTKYVLVIDPNVTSVTCKKKRVSTFSIAKQNTGCGMGNGASAIVGGGGVCCSTDCSLHKFDRSETVEEYVLSADCWERELSSKLINFTLLGLNPGEAYILKLLTQTGDRETRKPIFEFVRPKPEPVIMLSVDDIQVDRAKIKWLAPEGHPHLRAFNIACASRDNKFRRDLAVKVDSSSNDVSDGGAGFNSYIFENLPSETEFTVSIASVCVLDNHKSMSRREKITFVTLPRPPKSLELEGRFCNSLTVSWEPPLMLSTNFHK